MKTPPSISRNKLSTLCCASLLLLIPQLSNTDRAEAQHTNAAETKDFRFAVVSIHEVEFGYNAPHGHGITPDGYSTSGSIEWMIKYAYGQGEPKPLPDGDQTHIANLPAWADQRFLIDARVDERDMSAWQQPELHTELLRSALRKILAERFHLAFHEQQVHRDGYRLVVRKSGITFKPSPPGEPIPPGRTYLDGGVSRNQSRAEVNKAGFQQVSFYTASMADLAEFLNLFSDRPIYDKTGLNGRYDFTVDQSRGGQGELPLELFQIQRIGLDLKPGKGPGISLVIDHIEKPSPN